MYSVFVNESFHSRHDSYRDAVDQAGMVHGRVTVDDTGMDDRSAWVFAKRYQGFEGDFEERAEYEAGAAGV